MKINQSKYEGKNLSLQCTASPEDVERAFYGAAVDFAQRMGLRNEKGKNLEQLAAEQLGIKDLDAIVAQPALDILACLAAEKKDVFPAFPPKASADGLPKRGASFDFSALITPKPEYELTSYDPVAFAMPPFAINEQVVQSQLNDIAESYTEYLTDDPRPVAENDACLIALEAIQGEKRLDGLSTEGRTYIMNQGFMPPEFDAALMGMQPGETKSFDFAAPVASPDEEAETVHCTVTVKEIQKRVIPAITDEWVSKNMPLFRDAKALEDAIRSQISQQAKKEYEDYKMGMALNEVSKRFKGSIPDEFYENAREGVVANIRMQAQMQGMTMQQLIDQNGGEQQFNMLVMIQTRQTLVQGFALDAVFRHEKMELTDDDIKYACQVMNPNGAPAETRRLIEEGGRGIMLVESAQRLKANKWLVETAEITEQTVPTM